MSTCLPAITALFKRVFSVGFPEKSASLRKSSRIPLNEVRQRADVQRRMRPLRAPFTQILLNWSDAQAVLLVTQSDCQQKVGFARNRTRSTTKSNSFPSPETHTKATGNDGWHLPCEGRKRGKIRPASPISREVMHTRSCTYHTYTLLFSKWEGTHDQYTEAPPTLGC